MMMISISKPKLLALFLILITASSSFYLGQVLGTPAPTKNLVCEPGGCGGNNLPCTDNVYLDGTTPVDSVAGSSQIVGTAGQDMGAFLNSIVVANDNVCFQPGRYLFTTTWIVQTNVTAWGLTNPKSVVLTANANSISIIGVTSVTTDTTGVRINGLGFSANGKTNIVGVNFNMSLDENTLHNQFTDLEFQGAGFTYCGIFDGNEDSIIGPFYIDSPWACDISLKVIVGYATMQGIIYGQPPSGGNAQIHVAGQVTIRDSVLTTVVIEDQTVSQSGGAGSVVHDSQLIDIESSFLANGSPAGRIIKRAQGDTSTVFTLRLVNDYFGINAAGKYMFGLPGAGTGLIIMELIISGCTFTAGVGSFWLYTNSAANGNIRISHLHWDGNFAPLSSVLGHGDYGGIASSGFGFFFQPEPAAFNQSSPAYTTTNHPALPAGTGSGNAVRNDFPWPVTVYMNVTSSAGVLLKTGIHIIDCSGDQCLNNAATYTSADQALKNNPDTVIFYPGEKIYFATNVAYAWTWYGDEW